MSVMLSQVNASGSPKRVELFIKDVQHCQYACVILYPFSLFRLF